jgi:thiamine pyrophosphokinase
MRWVIFCWSPSDRPPESLRPDDVIVCADSGVEYARRCGVVPSIVLGDFDSYEGSLPPETEIHRLPAEKDDTDTMYAARLGLERGCREFLIAGGIGGRLDHTLGAVQTLSFIVSHGGRAVMSDGWQTVEVLQAPVERALCSDTHKYCSLLALSETVEGVTLEGFKYPLANATLSYDFPLAVSNEIISESAILSVRKGRFALIRTSD